MIIIVGVIVITSKIAGFDSQDGQQQQLNAVGRCLSNQMPARICDVDKMSFLLDLEFVLKI
jgi:hypothetical protein